MSRSASHAKPGTVAEVMARAQLLLNFPADDKMDEWRDTIQCLIGFADVEGSQRVGPPQRPQAETTERATDWYVSNVSIISYCSMLLYYLFWMFYTHYYAILYYFLGLTY